MTQLHTLSGEYRGQRSKRIGRGGKRGSYSGRGVKGQRSRAGRRIRPAERDLILRIPKKRGFSNKPVGPKPAVIDVARLIKAIKKHDKGRETPVKVNRALLVELELIHKRYGGAIKILGKASVDIALNFEGIKASRHVIMEVIKAGGKIG